MPVVASMDYVINGLVMPFLSSIKYLWARRVYPASLLSSDQVHSSRSAVTPRSSLAAHSATVHSGLFPATLPSLPKRNRHPTQYPKTT